LAKPPRHNREFSVSQVQTAATASYRLTEGSVGRHLVRLVGPLIWAILANMAYNLADMYFVGQLGPQPLAAISFSFPVVAVVMGLTLGLSIGTSSVISRARGEEAGVAEVGQLGASALLLAAVLTIAITGGGLLTLHPLFHALGASDELLGPIGDYMVIWYLGSGTLVVSSIAASGLLRASGDTLTPSIIMIIAAVVNFSLDPLLIFGWGPVPGFGIAGAALATVFTRGVGLFVIAWVVHRRGGLVLFRGLTLSGLLTYWRRLLWVALPAALTNLVSPLAIALVIAIVARFGPDAVAGFGVASRVEMLAVVPLLAATAGMGPLVGQNWGARHFDRVWRTLELTYGFAVAWGVIVAMVLGLFGHLVMALFSDAEAVRQAGVWYLYLVPITYGGYGVIIITNAACNAVGKPLFASALNLSRTFVVYVPGALLGAWLLGLHGIYLAAAAANVTVGVAAYLLGRQRLGRRAGSV
jgi:putative MATE family efflux protein